MGLCTIGNALFARVADLNVNDGRVVALRLHGHDNQLVRLYLLHFQEYLNERYIAKLLAQSTGNGEPQGRVQIPKHSGIYTFKNEKFGKALDHRPSTDGVIGHDPHNGNNQRV